jgi:hypothetical protein
MCGEVVRPQFRRDLADWDHLPFQIVSSDLNRVVLIGEITDCNPLSKGT